MAASEQVCPVLASLLHKATSCQLAISILMLTSRQDQHTWQASALGGMPVGLDIHLDANSSDGTRDSYACLGGAWGKVPAGNSPLSAPHTAVPELHISGRHPVF